MSKTRSLHHIVFATNHRKRTVSEPHKRQLYAYIYGIIKQKKCYLLRINGMSDHIHLLVDIHPTVALAELVKEIKQWSSRWLRQNPDFPHFDGWGEGYYAVTIGVDGIDACKRYIMNQESHHQQVDLISEVAGMAAANSLEWHADDWA